MEASSLLLMEATTSKWPTQTGTGDRPLAEIRINRVTIHANPLAG
ncbi:Peptidyl-prolyl cis-trans isomerase CYP18-1 [Ananas comosus]|uniref:Peptidyl-prolyl cis-trans isomerase CYP18-1 n=1 Tax=Ananas comosus TaxID=4615 RepID=A0A199W6U0_ANACO|nr:Peptidyl-prolyl cis-trans isomerase CYP18-1 [Ananas comosus]